MNLARLFLDDSCDAEPLMDGANCRGQGLLHLLNAFGRRLLRLGSRAYTGTQTEIQTDMQTTGPAPPAGGTRKRKRRSRSRRRFGRADGSVGAA